jgi:membrane-associated protein
MFDLVSLIEGAGYLGLFGIIFAESGLFFGFFLPGDSLLFTAGFLASQDFLNIYILVPLLFIAAVLGDNIGYAFGSRIGPRIFTKEESVFFKKGYLIKAGEYFNKYGGKTIILARFVPVVRTFAPILAGVAKMNYKQFFIFNVLGGFLWAVGLTILGYFLGSVIPNIDRYIVPIVLAIVLISLVPAISHILLDQKSRSYLKERIKSIFRGR